MNRDEILNMPHGREIDVMIATKFLGLEWIDYPWWDGTTKKLLWWHSWGTPSGDDFQQIDDEHIIPWDLPGYSIDIYAAWEITKHFEYNWNIVRNVSGDGNYRMIYAAPGMPMAGVTAEIAPLAICRAALLATLEAQE